MQHRKISRALTIPKRPAGKDREENRRIAKKEKERLAAMDKLVGEQLLSSIRWAQLTQSRLNYLSKVADGYTVFRRRCKLSATGAGPIDHATNALWTQEIMKILTRDDAYIFAEPVDRKMYPE